MTRTLNTRTWWVLVVACGALLVSSAGGLAWRRGFDGLYGQDAYAYFDYASGPLRAWVLQARPPEPFFWPPGYPLLVTVSSLLVGSSPLAGQLTSLLMGGLVPILTALLARELFPDDLPLSLLAGLVAALPGQLWQSSIVVMADTAGLALATAAVTCLARHGRTGRARWLLLGTLAFALATLCRWIYGLVALPAAIYTCWSLARLPWRRALPQAVGSLAVGLGVLGSIVGTSFVGLLESHTASTLPFIGNFQVYSWAPGNALAHDFLTVDGHLQYAQPNGVYYAAAPAHWAYLGPILAFWILVGVVAALRTWPRATLGLLGGWTAVVLLFHAGAPWQNFRFTLAYLPPLAILCASGVCFAWRRWPPRLARIAAVSFAVGVAVTLLSGVRLVQGFLDRKADELAVVALVEAETPAGAHVLSFGPTLALRHYTDRPTLDLYDVSSAEVAGFLTPGRPTFAVVDPVNLATQWPAAAPGQNFVWLATGPGLEPVASSGAYTLYRVGGQ